MIKCYDERGEELESTIEEICSCGEILILETDEDYKKLKSMVEEDGRDYKSFLSKICFCGYYSYEDACDILKLCKDKKIVCYTEDDKYYVGVFDR